MRNFNELSVGRFQESPLNLLLTPVAAEPAIHVFSNNMEQLLAETSTSVCSQVITHQIQFLTLNTGS